MRLLKFLDRLLQRERTLQHADLSTEAVIEREGL